MPTNLRQRAAEELITQAAALLDQAARIHRDHRQHSRAQDATTMATQLRNRFANADTTTQPTPQEQQ